jgi:hypothetical protein
MMMNASSQIGSANTGTSICTRIPMTLIEPDLRKTILERFHMSEVEEDLVEMEENIGAMGLPLSQDYPAFQQSQEADTI